MGLMPNAESRGSFVAGIGVILLLGAVWVVAANESAVARWRQGMSNPDGKVLVLGAQALPDMDQQGHQVLVTGTPEVVQPARDEDFRMRVDTPLLERRVEMFQWQQRHYAGQTGYQMDWADHAIDSSHFEQPRGHANRQTFPFHTARFEAARVRLGHYLLSPVIVRALPGVMQPVAPEWSALPANLKASFRQYGDHLGTADDASRPNLGDLRVEWLAKPLMEVTVVAKVRGQTLVPAATTDGGQGFQVWLGKQTLTDVFASLPLPPPGMWVFRVLALLLALSGAGMMLMVWEAPKRRVPWAAGVAVAALLLSGGLTWLLA